MDQRSGQARSSSGLHSNGFSLVRKVVELNRLDWQTPCPFAPDLSLGEALLEPTRIYVKPLLAAIRETDAIKGLAHITGGGFTENIPRVLPDGLGAKVNLDTLSPPPVFSWIAENGGVASEEMLRTFNCGTGMVVIVSKDQAEEVSAILRDHGEAVTTVGELTSDNAGAVSYSGVLKL